MSEPAVPPPVRLIVSALAPRKSVADQAVPIIEKRFGRLTDEEGPLPFDYTDYYVEEMGPGIQRWLWSFEELLDRGAMAAVKLFTNEIEQTLALNGRRRVNLDPGFLSLENFVLVTGKNHAHRIYIGDGVFADLTLIYRRGSFRALEWTYPDYAEPRLISVLNKLREKHKWELRNRGERSVLSEV